MQISTIDKDCENYAFSRNINYQTSVFEDTILVKIPYRYKKFEVNTYNCTMYDELQNCDIEVVIQPVSLFKIKDKYTCSYKMISIKAIFSRKHPHDRLLNE
jgi:hypothetical protein